MHIKSWIYVVLFLVSFACGNKKDASSGEWTVYRGGNDASQFSELDQINVNNIHLLEPAWIFNTWDGGEKTTIECNPIIIGKTMYITSPALALIALDAVTGIENRLDKSQIIQTLSKGKGVMPAFPQFTEAELEKLAAYLLEGKTENRSAEIPKIGLDKYVLQGFRIFTDQDGFPASKAPWSTLTAIDLATFSVKWKVPLGYYPALREKGILEDTGTMNYGGCVATAGGLVFVGATADELFRAFDADSGKELWSYKLPTGGYAVPSVYEVDGKQYVVIAAGGGNRMGTPSGDAFIAFSLADEKK